MTQERTPRKKNNKSRAPGLLKIVIVVLTATFLYYTANFTVQRIKLVIQRKELYALLDAEEEKKQLYLEEIERIGTPQYYEYMARKYLGYIYPDEKVLIVTDENNQ